MSTETTAPGPATPGSETVPATTGSATPVSTTPGSAASPTTRRGSTTDAARVSRVGFGGLLASEWIKLRSLRSTWWTVSVIIVLAAGIGLLVGLNASMGSDPAGELPLEMQLGMIVQIFVISSMITQLAAVVLGALSMTGEYATGMIRSTMTASPSRIKVYVAKALVTAAVIAVTSIVASVVAYFVAMPSLLEAGVTLTIADPSVLLPMVQTALYLVVVTLFSLGIGAMVRSSAGAIAIVFAIILVLPTVLVMLPYEWVPDVQQFMLTQLGTEFTSTADWSTVPGDDIARVLGALAAWPALTLIGGGILLARRDV